MSYFMLPMGDAYGPRCVLLEDAEVLTVTWALPGSAAASVHVGL